MYEKQDMSDMQQRAQDSFYKGLDGLNPFNEPVEPTLQTPIRFEVLTYDVWGNDKDGFEINDVRSCGYVTLDSVEDQDIIKALKADEYLAKHVRRNMLKIEGDTFHISIERAKNGYPLYGLRRA